MRQSQQFRCTFVLPCQASNSLAYCYTRYISDHVIFLISGPLLYEYLFLSLVLFLFCSSYIFSKLIFSFCYLPGSCFFLLFFYIFLCCITCLLDFVFFFLSSPYSLLLFSLSFHLLFLSLVSFLLLFDWFEMRSVVSRTQYVWHLTR